MQHKKDKRKKLLLMLPLFAAPLAFLVYLFTGTSKKAEEHPLFPNEPSAFNAKLPSANPKDVARNKLEIYMQAQRDSAKKRDELQKDPYEKQWFDPSPPTTVVEEKITANRSTAFSQAVDPNEKKVNDRLEKLMQQINSTATPEKEAALPTAVVTAPTEQLENLMATLHQGDTDPEMTRIESMLEKVLDLKYPQRVEERLNKRYQSTLSKAFSVSTEPRQEGDGRNEFFGISEDDPLSNVSDASTILAAVDHNQVVYDNSTIKLRLLQDVYVKGVLIPSATALSGKCSINDERVTVTLTDLVYKSTIYPISLTVYDTDGLLGINAPGAISREAAKNGIDQSLQNLDIYNANPSVAAQATSSGIQTLKTLITKRTKRVQATLKAGHKVLLKGSSTQINTH